VGVAGRPAGTVAGRVAGRLPTGRPRPAVRLPDLPAQPAGVSAPLVVDLTAVPPTARPAPSGLEAAPSSPSTGPPSAAWPVGPGVRDRLAAVAVLAVGLSAAACALLVDLGTGGAAVAWLVALWGVVVGGFAAARPSAGPPPSAAAGAAETVRPSTD